MKRVRLSELGQRRFKRTPYRMGDYLGEAKEYATPTQFRLPEVKVLWDGTYRPSRVLLCFVEIFEGADDPPV